MSFFQRDSIKVLAETVNIPSLSDDVAAAIIPDVEYRLREIIQEAIKFRRHSKRQRMTTEDISHALRVRNIEAVYGFSFSEPIQYKKTTDGNDIYYTEDRELDFDEVMTAPLPPCPYEISMGSHWLAVEGVIPAIPENVPQIAADLDRLVPQGGAAAEGGGAVVINGIATSTGGGGGVGGEGGATNVGAVLSQELQVFYDKITAAVVSGSDAVRDAALVALTRDAGLQPLLPYFVLFISNEVTRNLRNLPILMSLMRMVRALLSCSHLHIEPYLHQLMPSILTCVVGKRLCSSPSDNHWALRDFSAHLISTIVQRYGVAYASLQPRITRTLLQALVDVEKPLTTHYGAIVGLDAMGPRVVSSVLLPCVKEYVKLLVPALSATNERKKIEATRVYGALLRVTGNSLRKVPEDFFPLDAVAIASMRAAGTSSSSVPLLPKKRAGEEGGEAMDVDEGGAAAAGAPVKLSPFAFRWNKNTKGKERKESEEEDKEESKSSTNNSNYDDIADIFGSSLTPFVWMHPGGGEGL